MKNVRLNVIFAIVGIVLIYAALMWIYHGLYFLRDSAALTEGLGRFVVIVFSIVVITVVILFFLIRPLRRILGRISGGERIDEVEAFIARKTIARIPILIFVSYAVVFFIGPVISAILRTILELKAIHVLDTALTLFYDLSIGLVAALQAIHVVDIVLITPKEQLKTLRFDERLKDRGVRRKNMLVVSCSAYLAVALLLTAGYGFLRQELFYPKNVAEKRAAGQGLTIPDQEKTAAFSIAAGTPGAEDAALYAAGVRRSLMAYLWQIGLLSIIIFGCIYVLNFTALSLQRAQITRLTDELEKTAASDGDLSARLSIIQFDEIGNITHYINGYVEKLQNLLATIAEAAQRVTESSAALNESTESSAGIVNRLVNSVETIKKDTESQAEIVVSTETAIDAILTSIEKVSAHVETQASYVEQSSAAISEMTSNIGSVSKITSQADKLARNLLVVANEGGEAISSTLGAIRDIETASVKVQEIIGVISKIAAQTNLLSMNAAIEAAHAGESGRGFAVVADEVRKLAEDSSKSTKDIVEHIKRMVSRIENGVGLAEKAGEAFSKVSADIHETSNLMQTISSAMEEQKIGAGEILGSVDSLVGATEDIKRLSGDQAEQSGDMRKALENLVSASRRIQDSLKAQTESNVAIVEMVSNLKRISARNTSIVDDLNRLVHKA